MHPGGLDTKAQHAEGAVSLKTFSQDSTVDSMDYPMVSAGTERYSSKIPDGKTSPNEVLLPAE